MGDEFDFFDPEGVARPELVAKLRSIKPALGDPELMARLIDGQAGIALDLHLVGHAAEVRKVRQVVKDQLPKIQELARQILQLQSEKLDVEVLAPALRGVVAGDPKHASSRVTTLLSALETLAGCELKSGKGGRPSNDETAQLIVDAIAIYCQRMGISFTGAPRREQVDGARVHIVKTPAARLTAAVLLALGMTVPPETVASHMRSAGRRVR